MEGGELQISLDKLPVKRLESIEENGVERFPSDIGYEEKSLSQIRRIDFAWAVERVDDDSKGENQQPPPKKKQKKKKSSRESSSTAAPSLQWQSMVENLQLAHQELSVIIDLINTVEANDAVTVAGMTRSKALPHESLADLAVSTATKLQCYRHLGKYFKQSSKALEQKVAREAKFYGALIRLQQNWKVKRQRMAATSPGHEGFTIDLFDNSLHDSTAGFRPSSQSTIRIEHDSAGMLAINLPRNSCRSLCFDFIRVNSKDGKTISTKLKAYSAPKHSPSESDKEAVTGNESVKRTHLLLREVHQAIFDELVFDMVNRGAFNTQSLGVNVTGMQEDYLRLCIGAGNSIFISLVPSDQDSQTLDGSIKNLESALVPSDSYGVASTAEEKQESSSKLLSFPNRVSYEIYLRQIFHEQLLARAKRQCFPSSAHASGQSAKDGSGLIGHFCMSLAHRIFSKKVLMELDFVVSKVPYLHLISQPTWHSRTSSWTIFMKVPRSVLHANSQLQASEIQTKKKVIKSEFRTKVVVNDDCITVETESVPSVVGLGKGSVEDNCRTKKYGCDLGILPVIILQQVAGQVIRWLHEEALVVGIKANRDFLRLSIELEQGEILSLVAHIDPDDPEGCISWWLFMEDGFAEEGKLHMDIADRESGYKKFLGYLPLDVLYSTMMDLVSLCGGGGKH